MAANKHAGKKSVASNDFLQPAKPIINSVSDVGLNRAYNDGAATVSFSLPNGSAPATSYTVTASTGQSATGASSPIVVGGIASNATPTFTVTATNASGTSPQSDPSSPVTITTVPENTPFISASDVGIGRPWNNGAITVNFGTPNNGGKPITGYTAITAGGNGGGSASGSSSPITVGGLNAPGTMYIYVVATNANGTGGANGTSNMINVTCVPDAPGSVSASSPSVGSDTVSWSAPNDGGKTITGYAWTSSDGKSGTTTSTSVTVAQEMGTAQTYSVTATNANGTSAAGTSNSVTTTFSFAPFGFTPFGFSPFGFSPFGFTPFGFTPFGFVPPFSFAPYSNFSFVPFSFIPYGNFSFAPFSFAPSSFGFVCVGEDSEIITVDVGGSTSLTTAKDLKVGDKVLSPIWDNYDASINIEISRVEYSSLENPTVKIGTIKEIVKNTSDTIVYINGDKKKAYTPTHPILAKLGDNNVAWEQVQNLSIGDKVMEYNVESEQYMLSNIVSLDTEYFNQDVYLISVDDTDTFIASGIVCHK